MITSGINERVSYGITSDEKCRFLHALRKAPLKNIAFITIRCPKQDTKWIKLGKSIDWIRRYSTNYYIVRGTSGGSHMHLLAILNKGKALKFQRGIHFNCTYMNQANVKGDIDFREMKENKEKSAYYTNLRYELFTIHENIEKQKHIALICAMIKKHWLRVTQSCKHADRMDKKTQNHERILNYLEQNLNEPRDDDPKMYTDYYYCE